jgi:hypothetical protein
MIFHQGTIVPGQPIQSYDAREQENGSSSETIVGNPSLTG